MGFPSPATDYAESRLTIDRICQIDSNCVVIETTTGYAVINRSMKATQGDMVLISMFGRNLFARVHGATLRENDGKIIAGEELNEVHVEGVVTFTIHRTPATRT